ncbi:DUF4215 domain-containing protein [Vulgatibacter sp.]|uniref:DUF4215 domain-containing protein n=1 Tax=Vulgatibacter sp. TaxID=1971226 RepID=UPI00356447C9
MCCRGFGWLAVLAAALALGACGDEGGGPGGTGGTGGTGGAPAVCGDGVMQVGEGCDRGEENSDDRPNACRTDCTLYRCGDGVRDQGEACDGGAFCTGSCTVIEGCGNGIVEGDEACDDGAGNNDELPGACRTTCVLPACGDGVADEGEACDDGAANSDTAADACRTTCELSACGDGVVDAAESCDDGAANSDTAADACRSSCVPARCGDGILDGEERCDDGEANSDNAPDACRTTCTVATCGDGVADAGEACDEGDANSDENADACRTSCALATCGDGTVDSGEACDAGAANDDHTADACRTTCSVAACGDGVVDTGEACDDGNTDDLDGCSAACLFEAVCGDGVREYQERCDDGNVAAGDGCGATCLLETGVCGASIVDLNQRANFSGGQDFLFDGTLFGAGDDASGSCSEGDGEDLTLALWVPQRARVELTTEVGLSLESDTQLFVRGNCADPGTELACNEDVAGDMGRYASAVTLDDVAAGTQLYVTVDTWGEGEPGGDFTLAGHMAWLVGRGEACDPAGRATVCETGDICVASVCVQAICGDGIVTRSIGEMCDDGNTTGGDGCGSTCLVEGGLCTDALTFTFDATTNVGTVSGTTVDAGDETALSCADGAINADAFATFTSPIDAAWDIRSAADFNTVLAVQATCGDASAELACSNSARFDQTGEDLLRIVLDAGASVTVVIDGYGAWNMSHGTFTLTATPLPIRAEGAACDPSEALDVCAAGLYCHQTLSLCTAPACGNGWLEDGEQCDDGNTAAGDGCSDTCSYEVVMEVEPNDDATTAMSIATGVTYQGAIDSYDIEYFAFAATAGTTYAIETSIGSLGACTASFPHTNDATLLLYDTDGSTELTRSWTSSPNCPRISFTPSVSGTYYLAFREFMPPPNNSRTIDPWFLSIQ